MNKETYLKLMELAEKRDKDGVFAPDLQDLCRVFKGFNKQRLYMYSANPNGCKSLFMEYVAAQALHQNKKVWFHSIEEAPEDVLRLMLSAYNENLARDARPDESLMEDFPYENLEITGGSINQSNRDIFEQLKAKEMDLFIFDYITIGAMDVGDWSRPDVELKMIAQTLHTVALNANCAVLTASQLNRASRSKETMSEFRDATVLQGSYALQDPLDIGMIATTWFDMSSKEQNLVGAYWNSNPMLLESDKEYMKKHTLVIDIYKNRSGEKSIKIFVSYDPICIKMKCLDIHYDADNI